MGKTCRHNEGDTPAVSSKYTAGVERANTPGSSIGTKSSGNKPSISDEFGY